MGLEPQQIPTMPELHCHNMVIVVNISSSYKTQRLNSYMLFVLSHDVIQQVYIVDNGKMYTNEVIVVSVYLYD